METRENPSTANYQQETVIIIQEGWKKIHAELKLGHERLKRVIEEMPLVNEEKIKVVREEAKEGKMIFRNILATDEEMLAYVLDRSWHEFYQPVCELIHEIGRKIKERESLQTAHDNLSQNSNQEINQ